MMAVLDTGVLAGALGTGDGQRDTRVRAWLSAQAVGELHLSAITVLEIERAAVLERERGRTREADLLARWLDERVLPAFAGRILPVDQAVARAAARMDEAGDCRNALVAASARVLGAVVATGNAGGFAAFGVPLVDPWAEGAGQGGPREPGFTVG